MRQSLRIFRKMKNYLKKKQLKGTVKVTSSGLLFVILETMSELNIT